MSINGAYERSMSYGVRVADLAGRARVKITLSRMLDPSHQPCLQAGSSTAGRMHHSRASRGEAEAPLLPRSPAVATRPGGSHHPPFLSPLHAHTESSSSNASYTPHLFDTIIVHRPLTPDHPLRCTDLAIIALLRVEDLPKQGGFGDHYTRLK